MRGKEIPNHIQTRMSMVVKGTAPEECTPQMKKLRKNPVPNTIAGKNVAVWKLKNDENVKNCSWYNDNNIVYQSGGLFPIIALQCSEHSRCMIARHDSAMGRVNTLV